MVDCSNGYYSGFAFVPKTSVLRIQPLDGLNDDTEHVVHGGVTHNTIYVLGFDCAHRGDFLAAPHMPEWGGRVRDATFAKDQLQKLIDFIADKGEHGLSIEEAREQTRVVIERLNAENRRRWQDVWDPRLAVFGRPLFTHATEEEEQLLLDALLPQEPS